MGIMGALTRIEKIRSAAAEKWQNNYLTISLLSHPLYVKHLVILIDEYVVAKIAENSCPTPHSNTRSTTGEKQRPGLPRIHGAIEAGTNS